jgi:citrate synthase
MRHISSSLVDPYSATAGAAAALYGPLHGGACEAVLRMLEEIGSVENIPKFLEKVKSKDAKYSDLTNDSGSWALVIVSIRIMILAHD